MRNVANYVRKGMMLAVLALLPVVCAIAQDSTKTSNFSLGADVVSRYVWRGINLGGGQPHIQPWAKYSFGSSGLVLGAWGSQGISNGIGNEIDLYLSYTPVSPLTVSVTNYYFPVDAALTRDVLFSDYEGHNTMEASLLFNGTEKIPFTLLLAMNFLGLDGVKANGDPVMSKYAELGYSKVIADTKVSPFVGFALDDNAVENVPGFYGNYSMGVINLGLTVSKELKISESLVVPVKAQIIMNPESENMFLVFGMSF